ncbi:MAG: M48 family metallopeptidase [Burkholderiales bacterium]|nr:M48 family metallopeptidase [Burkholderiales bacterium]MDE1926812.1 M48 family metallopeptidase [Burkholderiales bacterium]MDE2158859.1 M48 family metallopeptidase [Burkholderiales bacterium]MDE2504309.1 M48 family metallopeptidase [Burkholderiales bacterium]
MPRGLQASPTTQQLSLFDDAPPPPAAPPVAPAPPPAPAFLHPHPQREIVLGGHRIAYALRRSRRRSIGFVVGVEGLAVSAPRWVGIGEIEAALREKSAWILRKLHEQREREQRLAQARVEWRDGVVVPFLGRSVTVQLGARGVGAMFDAEAERPTLLLALPPSAQAEQIRDAVQSWLQRQARRVFEERCVIYAQRLGVRMKRLALSSAATRWGSASADGSIRLNWRLIHYALPVIDYVVTHELAHLREMNHSAAFWCVVREALPDYESARGALKTEVLPVYA